jgi:hypothetical protein
MNRFGATILLSLLLGLLGPTLAQADVWRCTQPDGTYLFTNSLRDVATCQQYESAAAINVAPSPSTTGGSPVIPMESPSAQPEPPPQAPPPYPQAGYDQGYNPYYDYPYYYSYPGVYGLFLRPRAFPFPRHSQFHSFPRTGSHHRGRHGGGHRGAGHR